jgi:hypothetical protein
MWYFNGQPFNEVIKGMEGFVYLITNTTNNKKYIGKKNFWERRKDPKTGRRKTKESTWQKYFGSCEELKEDVKQLGEDKFIREILYICPHKKSMSYYETLEQFKRDALLREDYYNTNISGNFYSSEKENIYSKVLPSLHQEQKEHH